MHKKHLREFINQLGAVEEGSDQFWLFDGFIGYRFARRLVVPRTALSFTPISGIGYHFSRIWRRKYALKSANQILWKYQAIKPPIKNSVWRWIIFSDNIFWNIVNALKFHTFLLISCHSSILNAHSLIPLILIDYIFF